jgi:hypothetical protein
MIALSAIYARGRAIFYLKITRHNHYKQYSANCPNRELIIDAEKFAQDKKIGVWSGNHVKPWDYRHAKK